MTLEQLRAALAAALAATIAFAAIASTSCTRERARHEDTFVPARTLGESTASPGSDPSRPLAPTHDTQEVSATISRPPAGAAPVPVAVGPAAPPTPVPPAPPPTNAGAFAPPPPPPR